MMQATQRPLSDCYRIHIHRGTLSEEEKKKKANFAFVLQ